MGKRERGDKEKEIDTRGERSSFFRNLKRIPLIMAHTDTYTHLVHSLINHSRDSTVDLYLHGDIGAVDNKNIPICFGFKL